MRLRHIAVLPLACALWATEPNDATRRWWAHVTALSNDSLEGRDTGSEGYRKAAAYVVERFQRAGLKPAGENDGWYQSVPLHVVKFRADQSEVSYERGGKVTKLEWLRQISIPARMNIPATLDAGLIFDGDAPATDVDYKGKILVRIRRGNAQAKPGIAGTLNVDVTAGVPEPPRWPVSYAVAMSIVGMPAAGGGRGAGNAEGAGVPFRFNPSAAEGLFEGSGHTYKELMAMAAAGKPLPTFALPVTLHAKMKFEAGDLKSDNIIGVLPGSDPALANEYVVVSAHLDGYGVGEPWNGDRIYNGAFDDAAYVATLIDFAERLKAGGTKLKRPVLFLVVTAEEKGLLGSRWFAAHPTVPKEKMVANVNLDQLRPIFPLKTLTTLAVDESSLGETVKLVAGSMGIRIQADPEPERNLLRRSDHWSLMQIGVPAVGFVFGYENGTPEEAIYRRWYAERYHSPADDLNQPWLPEAAAKFNEFFGKVVETVANGAEKPRWKPGSSYAPR